MKFENFQSQAETGESNVQYENAVSHIFERVKKQARVGVLGIASVFGGEAMSDSKAYAQVPVQTATAETVSSNNEGESIEMPPLTKEEIEMRIQQEKMEIQAAFRYDYARLESLADQAKIMHARILLPKLVRKIRTATDDFELIALHEMIFELASVAGKHSEALHSNRALTSENERYTHSFLHKETDILKAIKQNPMNIRSLPIQREIDAEILKRNDAIEIMDRLLESPDDPEGNQKLGEYLFFECSSEKGLPYLAKGNNALHRFLALQPDDALVWMNDSMKETDGKRRVRMQLYAVSLYQKDPSRYQENQPMFDQKLKMYAGLLAEEPQKIELLNQLETSTKVANIAVPTNDDLLKAAKPLNLVMSIQGKDKKLVQPDGTVILKGNGNIAFPILPLGSYRMNLNLERKSGSLFFVRFPIGGGMGLLRVDGKKIGIGPGQQGSNYPEQMVDLNLASNVTFQFQIDVIQKDKNTFELVLLIDGVEVQRKECSDITPMDFPNIRISTFQCDLHISSAGAFVNQIAPLGTVINR